MTHKPQRFKKLALRSQTIRQLDLAELRRVQGGDSEATCATHLFDSEATCVVPTVKC